MVQEVVLGEDILKISVFPLGDSGKPLEYLLKHPEFAESDKKRGGPHSPQTFVGFRFSIQLTYVKIDGTCWRAIK